MNSVHNTNTVNTVPSTYLSTATSTDTNVKNINNNEQREYDRLNFN